VYCVNSHEEGVRTGLDMSQGSRPRAESVSPGTGTGAGSATATANANIALIKYWGKADERLVIPTTSSLSITLDGMATTTTVDFAPSRSGFGGGRRTAEGGSGSMNPLRLRHPADSLIIDGIPRDGKARERVSHLLDIVRAMAGMDSPAQVTSHNTVPFGAGLASSASAFAALAAAASWAAGLDLSDRELSRLARRGSGSACRSIFGGLAIWHAGDSDETSYAEPVDCTLDLAIIVVAVSTREKPMSSRDAMRLTMRTSPLYRAWVDSSARDLRRALDAIRNRDLKGLGEVCEANSLGMHAAMMSARPAILYWLPESVTALHAVAELRRRGLPAWASMDAGPNVKVLTSRQEAQNVARALRGILPDQHVSVHLPGRGVRRGVAVGSGRMS
jgi:diphosphomevalonate decarboxylase